MPCHQRNAYVVVGRAARRFELKESAARWSAALTALVAALAAADLTFVSIGRWWADRPMLAAVVTGVLFLSLTVVLVDAILERLRARELRRAIALPLGPLLFRIGSSDLSETRTYLDEAPTPLTRPTGEPWHGNKDVTAALRTLEDVALDMADAAREVRLELFLGGSDVASLYQAALKVGTACHNAVRAIRNLEASQTHLIDTMTAEFARADPYARYLESLWSSVGRAYNSLVRALAAFEEAAYRDLGEELRRPGDALSGASSTIRFKVPEPLKKFD